MTTAREWLDAYRPGVSCRDDETMRAALRAVLKRHHGLHLCGGTWYAGDDESYQGTVARRQFCPTVASIDAALGTVTP